MGKGSDAVVKDKLLTVVEVVIIEVLTVEVIIGTSALLVVFVLFECKNKR